MPINIFGKQTSQISQDYHDKREIKEKFDWMYDVTEKKSKNNGRYYWVF